MRETPDCGGRSVSGQAIYLDHHASTPMDYRVIASMIDAMRSLFGNANNVEHSVGRAAANAIDRAKAQVAALVDAEPSDVWFTTGASDALRMALDVAVGTSGRSPLRVASMKVEHPALLGALGALEKANKIEIVWLAIDGRAQLRFDSLQTALASGVDLVCLMAANNEVGTVYPISRAISASHAAGADILIDATQAAGRIALHVEAADADYVIVSGHKIYGPKGAGAVISSLIKSHHWDDLGHRGTPNVPAIVGFGVAAELARAEILQECDHVGQLRNRLEARLRADLPELVANGDTSARLPQSLHISVPGSLNDAVIALLSDQVAISTGAACASGALTPSHVLQAMGLAPTLIDSALRISPGRFTTAKEIDVAGDAIAQAILDVLYVEKKRIAC